MGHNDDLFDGIVDEFDDNGLGREGFDDFRNTNESDLFDNYDDHDEF